MKDFSVAIADILQAAVFIRDKEKNLTYINPVAEKMTGYRCEDVLGVKCWQLFGDAAQRCRHRCRVDEAIAARTTRRHLTGSMVDQEGGLHKVSVSITPLVEDEEGVGAIVICEDLNAFRQTDRETESALRKSREEITESKAQLSLAMSLARLGPWVLDLAKGAFLFNDEFYSIYGTTAEQEGGYLMPVDTYFTEFLYPDDYWIYENLKSKGFRYSSFGNYQQLEHRILRRDGEVRHITVRFTLINNSKGELVKIIGANQDITNRKRVEGRLIRARQEAEMASRSKSEFLANMSHEIRTPLNGVMGMLQLLQTTKMQSQQEAYVGASLQSCRRLTRLLSDILDLSRVEAGKMQIREEVFDLRETFEAIGQLFAPNATAKGIELQFQIDPSIPRNLQGDVVRFQQIITNLVGNAVKFTREGRVVVETHSLDGDKGDVCRILCSVLDTGIGISDKVQERIFEPFEQAEQGYRRQFQGAGLGLAISKRLVELMGGSISMVSEVGKGSTFYLSLPFKITGLAASATETGLIKEETGTDLKILLAEDDAISRLVAMKILGPYCRLLLPVEDGRQALEKLREVSFDLVLMDIQMPFVSGLEAAEAVRIGEAGPENMNIPIIAMTACAMEGDRDKFLAAGMDGYVEKPVELHKLWLEVARVLEGRANS